MQVAGLVPYLGPLLAMLAPVLMMVAGPGLDPGTLMEIVLVLAVGFGFDNAVVIPFLLAGSVNLHPAVAMLAPATIIRVFLGLTMPSKVLRRITRRLIYWL